MPPKAAVSASKLQTKSPAEFFAENKGIAGMPMIRLLNILALIGTVEPPCSGKLHHYWQDSIMYGVGHPVSTL